LSENRDGRASGLLSNEQSEQAARLKVMGQMVRSLIDSEDRKRSGMRWEDILGQSGSSGVHAKKAIEDLIDLKYVVRIKTLTDLYGTTFFGRKWLMELEKS
jgi:hypothetical protein